MSHVMALLGTGLATIGLGLIAFDIAEGQAGSVLGTILAIKMLSFMLVAPLAAAVLVHVPVRTVLIASDLSRAGVAIVLPFVSDVWQIYALIVLLNVSSAVFTPAFQATIPRVVTDEREYGYALALSRLAYDLEALVSPALAGVLLLLIPAGSLFFGTAIGFIASATIIASLLLPKGPSSDVRELPFRTRLTMGTKLLFTTPALRGIFALHLAVAGSGSFALVQTVTLVRGPLGYEESAVALALGAMGAGSICSALSSPILVQRFGVRRVLLTAGVLLSLAPFGVPLVLVWGGGGSLMLLCGIWFILGIGYSGVLTPIGQVIRSTVTEDNLPAVFAAQFSLAHGWWLICFPLAGWLGALVSLAVAAVIMAMISLAAVIAAIVIWRESKPASGDDKAADASPEVRGVHT